MMISSSRARSHPARDLFWLIRWSQGFLGLAMEENAARKMSRGYPRGPSAACLTEYSAAWVRSERPSFASTPLTCVFTVFSLMKS